ncbi:L-serine ammonia-lyase, iron-sulfur-dependent subunit beta [Clostridium thermarum]|uniref:L-serine ammonia-lyase, iron-sulfur-dependent subunit beta n=1 Tax=Clostridium thermarum TaxID=1716543 RepID=UPI0013D407DE|nr:L-serine ammonia-lyase, iron-sulfur-dependent subunit beta [Clostridium thermarum]
MKNYSVFDIIGPIMIGPSSSHTAGAARLGKMAALMSGGIIRKVQFMLHGSFAKTYKGHGTDKALVAGIMLMDPWDERIRESLKIARKRNIDISFSEVNLPEAHPNSVKFLITRDDGKITEIIGASIGGGSIIINYIDGDRVDFTGEYPTIIIKHKDVPGVVSKVTTILYEGGVNIAFMKVFRSDKGQRATMIFECDQKINTTIESRIAEIEYISGIRVINPLVEGDK